VIFGGSMRGNFAAASDNKIATTRRRDSEDTDKAARRAGASGVGKMSRNSVASGGE
jgi:hypothetical protein